MKGLYLTGPGIETILLSMQVVLAINSIQIQLPDQVKIFLLS